MGLGAMIGRSPCVLCSLSSPVFCAVSRQLIPVNLFPSTYTWYVVFLAHMIWYLRYVISTRHSQSTGRTYLLTRRVFGTRVPDMSGHPGTRRYTCPRCDILHHTSLETLEKISLFLISFIGFLGGMARDI